MSEEPLELGEPDRIGNNVFVVNLRVKKLESELAAAKAALEAEQQKRMDWDVAFEGLEAQLKAAKADNTQLLSENDAITFKLNMAESENKRLREALEKVTKWANGHRGIGSAVGGGLYERIHELWTIAKSALDSGKL